MDKLLDGGVHINLVDKDGFTPLHKKVIGKKEAIISHLLRKGANPYVRDNDGATPLHYAVQVGALQTVKLLIKYRVDVNIADNDGWAPLPCLSMVQIRQEESRFMIGKKEAAISHLLRKGANPYVRGRDGRSPLDLSLYFGRDFKSYDLAKLVKLVPANRDV